MQAVVQVLLIGEEGDSLPPLMSYYHAETVVPTEDAQESGLRAVGVLMKHLDAARESVTAQAKADLPMVAEEQEKWERERREEERRHGRQRRG